MIPENATRFPLSWPTGWKRTAPGARQRARFKTNRSDPTTYRGFGRLTVAEAMGRLTIELDRLGAAAVLLSSNVNIRLDGLPRSGQAEPQDPGVAVYFGLRGKPRCLACDRWTRAADNIASIAAHVAAIRAVDRYGVGTLDQAFAGYSQLPPAATEWWIVLGVRADSGREAILDAHRSLAFKHHPDRGGSAELMARINGARDEGLRFAGMGA